MGEYTRGEVHLLLSISAYDAREADASAASLGVDDAPLIARWHDVRRVRGQVIDGKAEDARVLALAEVEVDQREIAAATGLSQATVSRRIRATVDEILSGLGGELVEEKMTSSVSACLRCGDRPRTRIPAVRRRIRGRGMVEVRPERQAALCAECLAAARERETV